MPVIYHSSTYRLRGVEIATSECSVSINPDGERRVEFVIDANDLINTLRTVSAAFGLPYGNGPAGARQAILDFVSVHQYPAPDSLLRSAEEERGIAFDGLFWRALVHFIMVNYLPDPKIQMVISEEEADSIRTQMVTQYQERRP